MHPANLSSAIVAISMTKVRASHDLRKKIYILYSLGTKCLPSGILEQENESLKQKATSITMLWF